MAGSFRITAMEGLTTQGYDEDDAWKDFYSEDESKQQKKEETVTEETEKEESKAENDAAYEDDFEQSGGEAEETERDKSEDVTTSISSHIANYVSNRVETGDDHNDSLNRSENNNGKKLKKKGKKSKGTNSHHNNNNQQSKPPPLNLYQNHIRQRLHNDTKSRKPQDTMSDQEVGRRRGRKLQRRTQMKKYHSMEKAVEQAGRDRLEQKYVELEELMSRPLTDTRGVRIPHKDLQRVMVLQHQHGELGHAEVSSSRHRVGAWMEGTVHTVQEEEEHEDGQAYQAIRILQTAGPDLHMQVSYDKHSPRRSPRNSRLTKKPPVPQRRRKGSVDSSPNSSSSASQQRSGGDSTRKHKSYNFYSSDEDEGKGEDDTPRRVHTDNHLKNSDNPKLREWLRRKDIEHRRAKKAERAKKREERNDKMVEQELKIARREKSSERVQQWMEVKRKEAARKQKEERKRRKQEAEALAKLRAKTAASGVTGSGVGRPQSAPLRSSNNSGKYTGIQRPDSAVEARSRLDPGDGSAPKPPTSKFVYKRPVSGRVRLMKLQNVRNTEAREADQKRTEELSAEEKQKKARTSYDAWLISKRKEDVDKRKEAKRQKDLIKSDPEMERIVPELAKRRIDRIKNGKKSIDTGISQIDRAANSSFGGGDFGEDGQGQQNGEGEGGSPKPSYKLEITGEKLEITGEGASIVELNSRARPATAKARMPIPQKAFSPRRPQSAKNRSASPKVRTVMNVDHSAEPNPFKLPFPEDKGVPDHVRRVQERIFSQDLNAQSSGSERPEPQGCASVESATCPKGVDASTASDQTNARSSMALLQEIEAAAMKEEGKTTLGSIQEGEGTSNTQAQPVSEESTQKGPSGVEQAGEEQCQSVTQKEEISEAAQIGEEEERKEEGEQQLDEERQEEEGREKEEEKDEESGEAEYEFQEEEESEEEGEKEDGEKEDGEKEEGGKKEGGEKEEEHNDEKEQKEEEEQDQTERKEEEEEKVLDGIHKPTMEDSNQHDTAEPEPVSEEEQAAESPSKTTSAEDKEEEENSSFWGEDKEDAQKKEGEENEDTPRRSAKRVSFSQDLTQVFEPVQIESSSNFDDERGDDDADGF